MKKNIKLFDPIIGNSEEKEIVKILKSGYWASGSGSGRVREFENSFCKYIGSKECVAVNSGTAALNLALSLFNIKNKEVILPSLTFVSTAHSILLNGGKPVFADIDPKTLCIDPEQIKKLISKKTAVILPVHFAGMACNMEEILKICQENKINLVEDAAHASGTKYKKKKIGTHGIAVCFSFHPVKNLAAPTGGLISINHLRHKKIKKTLNEKRWCGITNRNGHSYDVKQIGWNYYMNEFSAAIGIEQLKKLDKKNLERRKNAKEYFEQISLEEKMPFDKECSYHFYWIRVKNRTKFRKKLLEEGIQTGIHYKPIHQFSFYKSKIKLPITEKIGREIVTLPTHPNIQKKDLEKIIKMVNKFS